MQEYLGYEAIPDPDCVQLKYKYMMARYQPVSPG